MLIKRTERQARSRTLAAALQDQAEGSVRSPRLPAPLRPCRRQPRRYRCAAARQRAQGGSRRARAGPAPQVTIRKNICTFCSVGCTVAAEVANGVWIGQEPAWDSPINRGSHCAKGAAAREVVHGDRRLKYPMKLLNGHWIRVSWDTAINEIGDKLAAIREKSGPDSVYWLGSAKFSNEEAYLFRKLAAFWGTNNVDHARASAIPPPSPAWPIPGATAR